MGNKLKDLRTKRGLSQSAVAEFIGISRQMYNKYESGEVEPTVKAVKLLCKLYNVSYEQILDDDELKSNKSNYGILSSPTVAYSANKYGTKNNFLEIMNLIPGLLYSEKAKLLTALAQSMTADVEAGKIAQRYQSSQSVTNKTPDYKSFADGFAKIKELTSSVDFNSHGKKWTREEMNER